MFPKWNYLQGILECWEVDDQMLTWSLWSSENWIMVHTHASADSTLQIKPLHFSSKLSTCFWWKEAGSCLWCVCSQFSCVFCVYEPSLSCSGVVPSRTPLYRALITWQADINPVKSQIGAETNVDGSISPDSKITNSGVCCQSPGA